MRTFIRIAVGAALAVSLSFVWTVGQTGLQQTNRNLCELWANLPLPPYSSCEFQNILVYLWFAGALLAGAWLLVELLGSKFIRRLIGSRMILVGLIIVGAGLIVAGYGVWNQQIGISVGAAPSQPAPQVKDVVTAPSDIPKKIAAIDQARDILRNDVENTLNDGFRIFQEGRDALAKGDRTPLMQNIPAFYTTWSNLWKKIEDFRKANDGFEDIDSILNQTYRPELEKGFSSLQGAVGSLGDPPYKFDMNFYFMPHVQDFADGMMAWGKWMHATDANLLALRRKLSG